MSSGGKPRTKKSTKKDAVQKHFKFGMEFELFTLDGKGYMVDGAEQLIKRVKDSYPQVDIVGEWGKNMIEVRTSPDVDLQSTIAKSMEDFEAVLYCAEKEGLVIYPFGTYPGSFTPGFNKSKSYKLQAEAFGKQRVTIPGRCIGLHCHYTLPKGVYDANKKIIKALIYSKHKQSLVNIYNLFTAMDPALTTFTQCSPFYQGKRLGKDARMMVYRGGKELDYPQGIFANHPEFGALLPYRPTSTDLLHLIKNRFNDWVELMEKLGIKERSKHGSVLDATWNPVKINANGTMEQRGMDMTSPPIVVAVALIIKHVARVVQEQFVQVVPSDIGVSEPFKKEKDIIYIPPDSYVRLELQKKSAYHGLGSSEVHKYCSGLLKLAKSCIPEAGLHLLEPLETMLKEKKTLSDKIIAQAKAMNFDLETGLSNAQAAQLALKLSQNLYKEVLMTKQAVQEIGVP